MNKKQKQAIIIILCCLTFFSFSRTIYVDVNGTGDYTTIQAAINDSEPDDEILVYPGVYTGDGNRDIKIDNYRLTLRSIEGPLTTIIDCNGSAEEPHRGFELYGVYRETGPYYSSMIISGFTIMNGYAPEAYVDSIYETKPGGGAMYIHNDGGPTIINCIIKNNRSDAVGGGIVCFRDGKPLIIDTLFINNYAETNGGAIYCFGYGRPDMYNCSIMFNYAGSLGSGIYCHSSWFTMSNCIVSHNIQDNIYIEHYVPVIEYSNVEGGWTGNGNIDVDPCFIDPGGWDPNGTPGDTNDDFFVEGNYRLKLASLLINAGTPSYPLSLNQTDLDGNPRIQYGRIDIGSYEYQNSQPVAVAGSDQTVSGDIDGNAEVTLDGSGSYDDDGDDLIYQWSWTIDTNDYEANTVSPNIELPEGQHQIELIVNDGFVDSDPNYCIITVGPFQLRRLRMPRMIFSRSRARYVRARISMPRGVAPVDIDQGEPIVFMPGNVQTLEYKVYPSHWRQQNNTRNTRINATFDAAAIKSNLSAGYNNVTVQGQFTSGQTFSGTYRIRLR